MLYTVYVIVNESNSVKFYIGQTVDIERRMIQHNSTENHVGKYTKNKGLWKLMHSEKFFTRTEALKREKQLKSFRGREWIKNNILK